MRNFLAILLIGAVSLTFAVPAQAQGNPCLSAPAAAGCTHGLPTADYERLLADMLANPAPAVESIEVQTALVNAFTFFRVAVPGAQKYDAPNGNVVGTVGDGLNFVSIYGRQDGFAKLRDGTWMLLSDLEKTFASAFSGATLPAALPYPVAWIVQTSLTAQYPGGPLLQGNPVVKRYALVNLYATVRVGQWDWFLIAPGQWIEQRKISKYDPAHLPASAPSSGKWVSVDLYEQVMVAYEDRSPVAITLVSSGLPPLNTNVGTFTVYQRLELTPLRGSMGEADGYSLPNVPYAMFFDGEIGFHGVYWHDGFGFKRSHGCVNLSISDAKWLFEWAADGDLTVVVWNSR